MKPRSLAWFALFALAIATGLSCVWLPAPLPVSAPPAVFSAQRALEQVKAIAKAPHPSGSEENRRVREYLLDQMRGLGLNPRVPEGDWKGTHLADLYGELPGTSSTNPAILLVAHFDSVTGGPGASDDAAGVATILETVHALKAQGPTRNGFGILFTDGEERGLWGASMFVAAQPQLSETLKNIRLVVNLEARGNHGPVGMFQTAPDNSRIIEYFSRACPLPVAASFSQDVYRHMPNDSDFTIFMHEGKQGLNFAFIGGFEYYHSRRDTPENLSLRTLQHYGVCVLSVAEYFGRADDHLLETIADKGDATFFTLCRGVLIHYPAQMAQILSLSAAGLFVLVLILKVYSHKLRVGAFFTSLGVSLLAAVVSAGVGIGAVIGLIHLFKSRNYGPFVVRMPYESELMAALLLLAVAITWALRALLLKRVNSSERLAGSLFIWAALALTAMFYVPGGSYIFSWPALIGTVALFFSSDSIGERKPRFRSLLTAVPAPLLLTPATFLLYEAITIGLAPLFMVLAALAVCLLPE